MKFTFVFSLLLIFTIELLAQESEENPSSLPVVYDDIYLGGKFGLPYLIGVDIGYLIGDEERYRAYINGSAQTSVFWNSANVGVGYFLGRKGFSVGVRFNRYFNIGFFDSFNDRGAVFTPELAWFKAVGKRKNTLISFQLGAAGLNFSVGGFIF